MRTIVEVPKVSFPQYLTCHGYKLGTECWIRFEFAYLLDKISLIFLKKKKNPYVCFILKAGFFRQLSKKFFCKNIILDTWMSLHKNYFDRWQARFFFVFIFNVEPEKVNVSDLRVHLPPCLYPIAISRMFTVATLYYVCISNYCDQIGMDLEYEIVLSISHPH